VCASEICLERDQATSLLKGQFIKQIKRIVSIYSLSGIMCGF